MVGFRDAPAILNRSASLQNQVARALQSNFLLLHQPTPNAFILLDPGLPLQQQPTPSSCQWSNPGREDEVEHEEDTRPVRHRFRVTLGSQQCTCSEMLLTYHVSTRSPCAHILFIMLRVLRLSLEDPRVVKSSLTNHEASSLLYPFFNQFEFFL